jgi:phosphonate transport system substrate-binding protein
MEESTMKRSLALLLTLVMSLGLLAGCGSKDTTADESQQDGESGAKQIETLKVAFVPSREPQEIITATEPLKQLLKDELAKEGYEVGEVEITVGTTYEAVGEGLEAGTIDVGLIPGGTYVLYDDGAEVILTATRDGLNKDSDNAKDWNDGQPTEASDKQAVSYRALIIAGPSDKGQELAAKVNNGEELAWEDLDSANWSIMGTSSPAGYIYPALWLQDHYGKGISDLSSAVQSDSYASAFARLASGQVDVLVTYADARRDYAERWNSEFGREGSIWEETNVIGVTAPIYNDTISVSKNSPIMDDDLIAALQDAFINIGNTDEGKQVIAIYSHNGYQKAQSSDYDNAEAHSGVDRRELNQNFPKRGEDMHGEDLPLCRPPRVLFKKKRKPYDRI